MKSIQQLFLCLITFHALSQHTTQSIPNQRLIDGSHVSNPDGILGTEGVAVIDSLLIDIENRTTAQVAVIAVKSIGEADIFDFAQELFNNWGIGHENDNGLLILLVTDQRTIRFHSGTGMEVTITDVAGKRIQRDYMVPYFKDGDYEAGMISGVRRVHEVLTDPSKAADLEYSGEENEISDYAAWMTFLAFFYGGPLMAVLVLKSVNGTFANSKSPTKTQYHEMRLKRGVWLIEFGLIPLLIALAFWPGAGDAAAGLSFLALYFYFMLTLVHRLYRERRVLKRFVDGKKYFEAADFVRSTQWFWLLMAIIFPIPYLIYFFFHLTRKSHYRNHPRNCKMCNAAMRKLSERDDDQYLSDREKFEESIKSVNYDVWLCPACKAVEEWNYVSRKLKYDKCPSCGAKAKYVKSRRTVESATYSSAGKGEEINECLYCKKTFVSAYTIPKLVVSTSSSSSSFSSSSRSSGSSWGGGRSSGGGSSSSW